MNTPASNNVDVKSLCIPTIYIVAVAIPIVLSILFYFGKPSFVMTRREGSNDMHVSWKHIAKWVIIISALAWLGLYLYQTYSGTEHGSVCISYTKASAQAPAVQEDAVVA